jgi:hypothetical protein
MALALTVVDIDNSGKTTYVTCLVTPSGNYTTTGDTIDFTTIIGKQYLGKVFIAAKSPLYGYAAGTTGDSYAVIPGTTMANGKLKINTASATELGAGAYPARITGDANIYVTAAFDQNL